MSPGLFWVVGFKVFLSEGLSLGPLWQSFWPIPGMVHRVMGEVPSLQAVTARHGGISLESWSRMSCRCSSILLWWMKLSFFSLPFVGWGYLCLIGWSCILFEFGSLVMQFEIPVIIKWLEFCDCFQLHYRRWLHGSCDDAGCLVLYFADPIRVGLGSSAPCCLAILKHWSNSTSVRPPESHSIYAPCHACQLLHESKSHFDSGFSFLSFLFPSQPLVESHPQVGGVVLSKQSLAIDIQVGLLFLCWKAEDGIGGLPWVDSGKPPFCPSLQDVKRPLQSLVCSWKAPQDQIIGVYGSQDFMRHVSDSVVDEDKE